MAPRPAASVPPGLEATFGAPNISGPSQGPLNWKLWEVDVQQSVLASPPGDSEVPWSLKVIAIQKWLFLRLLINSTMLESIECFSVPTFLDLDFDLFVQHLALWSLLQGKHPFNTPVTGHRAEISYPLENIRKKTTTRVSTHHIQTSLILVSTWLINRGNEVKINVLEETAPTLFFRLPICNFYCMFFFLLLLPK